MKLIATFVLIYYFFCNLIVNAYKPIAALFGSKKQLTSNQKALPRQGIYKTLSGLLSSGKLSVLSHKHAEQLRMITNDSQEERTTYSWWPFVANKPKVDSKLSLSSSALDGIPEERTRSDSTTLLTNLVKQSLELNRNEDRRRQRVTFESTNLAGFMDYDPKVAAAQAHQRTAGRGSQKLNWFRA